MNKKVFKISDNQIKQMYLDGYSMKDIAKVAQDTKGLMALRKRLKDLGVDTTKNMKRYSLKISKNGGSRIYSFNEHIFDTIDTEEKAYWLGFLEADGYNHESHKCVAIRLSYDDYHHLEKFKEFVQYTGPIYTFERLTPTSKTLKKYCELNLCSVIFSETLAKLGCIQGKTYTLEFPSISEHLIPAFIRGYFDGDGCISIGKIHRRNKEESTYQLTFTGRVEFISVINNYINKETQHLSKLHVCTGNFAKNLHYTGRKICIKILHYIYKNANIYLDRKYQIYKQLTGSAAE